MQVSFKSRYVYNFPTIIKKEEIQKSPEYSSDNFVLPDFKQCSSIIPQILGVINLENPKLRELKKVLNGKDTPFSLQKASAVIKSLTDKQLMLYSEDDIKTVVQNIRSAKPDVSREQILKTMAQLTSFSSYNSIDTIEKYCEKEKISFIFDTDILSVNNIFTYLSNSKKLILKLPNNYEESKVGMFLDRNTIKYLRDLKSNDIDSFTTLKDNILDKHIKLILPDGWEAKTSDGNKSFNFVGAWGDLEKTVSSIIETENQTKKSAFNDDIISSVNDLFEQDMPVDILENMPDEIDEKEIANRLNPKTISAESIEKTIKTLSKFDFSSPNLTSAEYENLKKLLNSPIEDESEYLSYLVKFLGAKPLSNEKSNRLQELISLMMLYTTNVYSPRRIATEMKELSKKFALEAQNYGKTADDLIFIVPKKDKSYGLVNYQYSKVNNIPDEHYIYTNKNDLRIDLPDKKNKVFVLFDDFAGSGASLIWEFLPYRDFKYFNNENPLIISALTYTDRAEKNINHELKRIPIRDYPKDSFCGGFKLKTLEDFEQMLNHRKINIIQGCCRDSGYLGTGTSVLFPHVIPDNGTDISSQILEPLLRSPMANKSKIDKYRKRLMFTPNASEKI